MKKTGKYAACIAAICSLVILIQHPVHAEEDYTTDNYQVEITVNENQTYDITEKIDVDFREERHGIYRYIPYSGMLHAIVDNKETKEWYIAKVKDISVLNDPFETTKEDGSKVIIIGDEDTLLTGKHEYNLSYQYAMYNDQDDGKDVFYLNVIPAGWKSSISQAQVTIHMPKEFDASKLDVYSGYYSEKDTGLVSCTVSGKDIKISTLGELKSEEGVTVRVTLPETYFTNVPSTYYFRYLAIVIVIAFLLIWIFLWYRFGRNRKFFLSIEFQPPENLSSAELGYILDHKVDKRDMLSLIIYFASKGYLEIEEHKDGETFLKKKQKLPDQTPKFQKTFWKGLFQNADKKGKVAVSSISSGFYEKYNRSVDRLTEQYTNEKMLYENNTDSLQILHCCLLCAFVLLTGAMFSLCAGDMENLYTFVIPAVAYLAAYGLCCKFRIHKYTDSKHKKLLHAAISLASFFIAVIIEIAAIWFCIDFSWYLSLLFFVAMMVGMYAACHLERRTEYGAKMLGKILGFRDFMINAEMDRINYLVKDNPEFFYDILPYAYALGVTDQWIKKFECIKIDPPVWYEGSGFEEGMDINARYLFMESLERVSDGVVHQLDLDSSSSVSSGSYFEDSDGGFSGGGAGGGGGGSW